MQIYITSIDANRTSGFTLIELSIVLVIIGLLVGGVLVGRGLIHAAELRGQVADVEKLAVAVNTFRGKYNALPGDIRSADAASFGLDCPYWTLVAPVDSEPGGNGNGILEAGSDDGGDRTGSDWVENGKLFCHLFKAHLIPYNNLSGGPVHDPNNSRDCWTNDMNGLSNCIGIPTKGSDTFIFAGLYSSFAYNEPTIQKLGFWFWLGNSNSDVAYFSSDAYTFDSKMDDGMPNSGNVRATAASNDTASAGSAGSANCVNTDVTPNAYNSTYAATKVCALAFKIPGYE